MWLTIDSSKSSPAVRTELLTEISASEMIATSVVPPPMSMIMLAVGSVTGSPAPMAAAIGSSTRNTRRAPARVADEVFQHCLGDIKIGNDAVFERADRRDRAGSLADHLLGDQPDGVAVLKDAVGAFLDGHHGRFVEHDPLALDADKGVAGAQIDAHVFAASGQDGIEDHASN